MLFVIPEVGSERWFQRILQKLLWTKLIKQDCLKKIAKTGDFQQKNWFEHFTDSVIADIIMLDSSCNILSIWCSEFNAANSCVTVNGFQ